MSAGRTPGAVAVAKTSVVDVWVEQLDPRLGEDFGWRRLSNSNGCFFPSARYCAISIRHALKA